jgi:phosphohistidine phosphatase SixA
VQALQNGGYTIVFRHAITDQSQDDVVPQELEDCTKQRNLNERGRLQAGEIGAAISTLEIPIGIVLSSPYCRTRETALLAFGRAETTSRLDNAFINVDRRAELETALVQLVGEPPSAGTNTVLVTHGYNMQLALGVSVVEGEAVVVQRDGAGGFRVIAELTSEEWQELALR